MTIADLDHLPSRRFSVDARIDGRMAESVMRPDDLFEATKRNMARQLAEEMLKSPDVFRHVYDTVNDVHHFSADVVILTRRELLDLLESQYLRGKKGRWA